MGQQVTGDVEVHDTQVIFEIALPGALAFFEPMIESGLKSKATKLLEKK